jgi:glycosyltransferase involved in cell wall biosynthesis
MTNPKIILSVTNDLVSDQRVHKVATSLLNNGYDVVLFGRLLDDKNDLNRSYKTVRKKLFFNKGALFYAEYNMRLFLFLLFSRFDILVANDLDTLVANFLVSKLRGKKLVYDSHELFTEVPELNNRIFQKKFWLMLESVILPRLENNITVCDSIAKYYNAKYNVSFKVVRNIPIAGLRKDSDNVSVFNNCPKEIILIYQGALNVDRGIELMIDAVNLLDGFKLWIVGSGDIEKELKNYVNNLQLNRKVKFFGRISQNELSSITRNACLGLSLEQNTSLSYNYALPNKLFDYIHANIPVVVSDLPEMSIVVKKYDIGWVLTDNSPNGLKKLIENIFDNLHEYSSKRASTANAIETLNWEKEKVIYLEVVKNAK